MQHDLQSLIKIIAQLRSKDRGCPWDAQQTHQSLIKHLLEETYEVIDAIKQGEPEELADELGDLLLQIVFHAQIAKENNQFGMEDVLNAICQKMIRRHPHVFSDTQVDSVQDVLTNWEEIKSKEKTNEKRKSVLDGVVPYLPALLKAEKIQAKAAKVGFEWKEVDGALEKLGEELDEFMQAVSNKNQTEVREEFGDILFSLVNIARYLNINPEQALNQTTDKFIQRFKYIEKEAGLQHLDLAKMSLTEMDELWEKAKRLPVHNLEEPKS